MGIKQFKIPGIIYHTAHQIAGLLVMEKSQIQTLQFIIHPASEIPHQIPGCLMCQIIAEEPENHPEKIQRQQQQREPDNNL